MLSLSGMIILCLTAAFAGATLQERAGWKSVLLAQITVTALTGVYLKWIWDRPVLTQFLPFSNAIILGNWLPIVGAFFVGVCIRTRRILFLRRTVLGATLGCLCGYSLVSPILGNAPECGPSGLTGRIMEFQTTHQTCSAVCAANLLRLHDIPATEEELAELCLTRRGTHWLGVYRGLKLKTAGTKWYVVVEEVSPKDLTRGTHPPGVLALTFTKESAAHRIETGFAPEIGHAVVCLGSPQAGVLDVFDPAPDYGFESWNDRILEDVESAILLRLVCRDSGSSPFVSAGLKRPWTWKEHCLASR